MEFRRVRALTRVLLLGLWLCLGLPLVGGPRTVYFHNRPLEGRWDSGEFYTSLKLLKTRLTSRELERVRFNDGSLQVDTQSIPFDGQNVPFLAVAQALGLKRVDSSGSVDFVTVEKTPEAPLDLSTAPRRRGEFEIAGQRLDQILLKLGGRSDDAETARRIQAIGNKVASQSPLRAIPWRFELVRLATPNAACTGEGHVFITSGLLDLGLSDDEIAGVLGHEIAHGVRRHVFKRYELMREYEQLGQDYQRLSQEIAGLKSSVPNRLRIQVQDYERRRQNIEYTLNHQVFYSQVQEEEADVLGMRYALAAGYRPEGLGECLQKLERAIIAEFGAAVLREDLSHPPVKKRLEILEKARRNGGF